MSNLKTEHSGAKNGPTESKEVLPEIDASIVDYNLSLSIEERIRNHERSRTLAIELRKAGEKAYSERKS